MTFYGAAEDLKELCEEKQNSIECILIDAFNRGWRANEKIISDMYKQADSAIEQKIITPNININIGFLNI